MTIITKNVLQHLKKLQITLLLYLGYCPRLVSVSKKNGDII